MLRAVTSTAAQRYEYSLRLLGALAGLRGESIRASAGVGALATAGPRPRHRAMRHGRGCKDPLSQGPVANRLSAVVPVTH